MGVEQLNKYSNELSEKFFYQTCRLLDKYKQDQKAVFFSYFTSISWALMKGKKHLFWLGKRFILALDEASKFSSADKEKILILATKTLNKTNFSKFLFSLDFYLV